MLRRYKYYTSIAIHMGIFIIGLEIMLLFIGLAIIEAISGSDLGGGTLGSIFCGLCFGVVYCGVFGIGWILYIIKKHKKEERLMSEGRIVRAIITELKQGTVRVNGLCFELRSKESERWFTTNAIIRRKKRGNYIKVDEKRLASFVGAEANVYISRGDEAVYYIPIECYEDARNIYLQKALLLIGLYGLIIVGGMFLLTGVKLC